MRQQKAVCANLAAGQAPDALLIVLILSLLVSSVFAQDGSGEGRSPFVNRQIQPQPEENLTARRQKCRSGQP